jgi:hypothetical protein
MHQRVFQHLLLLPVRAMHPKVAGVQTETHFLELCVHCIQTLAHAGCIADSVSLSHGAMLFYT